MIIKAIFKFCIILISACGIPSATLSFAFQGEEFTTATHSVSFYKKFDGSRQWNKKSSFAGIAADSQKLTNETAKRVSNSTKISSIALVLGANYLYYSNFQNVWWDNKPSGFYFVNDWYRNYALEQDKCSHFFAAQFMARQWAVAFETLGWPRRRAYLLAAFSALLTETGTEILDGFQPRFRFSIPDYIADIDGAFYPYLQEVYPILRDLKMKISYHASPFYLSGGINIFEDYDGMTFWWSYNFRKLMPAKIKKFWPKFIWIALGYGVNQVWTGPHRSRELYLAIDFDFSYLPVKNRILRYLLNLVDQVHLGAPTLKLYPSLNAYYYFF